jgi:hypothetical protein
MWLASKAGLSGSTRAALCRQASLLCSRTLQLLSATGELQCLAQRQHAQLSECESIRAGQVLQTLKQLDEFDQLILLSEVTIV